MADDGGLSARGAYLHPHLQRHAKRCRKQCRGRELDKEQSYRRNIADRHDCGSRHRRACAGKGRHERQYVRCWCFLVFIQVIYVCMIYGPIAAYLVEAFPAKIRYTSLSLPYHIGNGVFGGLLPLIGLWSCAATGNIYAGLYYPMIVASITFVIGSLLLRETHGTKIWSEVGTTPQVGFRRSDTLVLGRSLTRIVDGARHRLLTILPQHDLGHALRRHVEWRYAR